MEEGGGQHDSAYSGCLDQMLNCTRALKFNKLNAKDLLLIRKKVFFCTEKIKIRIDIYELFNDEDDFYLLIDTFASYLCFYISCLLVT